MKKRSAVGFIGELFRKPLFKWLSVFVLLLFVLIGLSNQGALMRQLAGKIWWTFHHNQSAIVDSLITEGASLLDSNANWKDRERGRTVYYRLKSANHELLGKSFFKHVIQSQNRMETLYLADKLGLPQIDAALADVLTNKGDKQMAEDFMNCGSAELQAAAQRWASIHGQVIQTGSGIPRIKRGAF